MYIKNIYIFFNYTSEIYDKPSIFLNVHPVFKCHIKLRFTLYLQSGCNHFRVPWDRNQMWQLFAVKPQELMLHINGKEGGKP